MTRKTTTSPDAPSDALAKLKLRVERLRTRRARSIDETTEALWTDLTENPTPAFLAQLRLWCDADDGPIADEAARTLSMFAHRQDGPRIARMIRSGTEYRAMCLLEVSNWSFYQDPQFDKSLFAAARDIALGKCHTSLDYNDAQNEAISFMMRTDASAARGVFQSRQFWKPGNSATRSYISWRQSQPGPTREKTRISHPLLSAQAAWIEARIPRTRDRIQIFQLRDWLSLLYREMFPQAPGGESAQPGTARK